MSCEALGSGTFRQGLSELSAVFQLYCPPGSRIVDTM
jgi:hypothetical protein